MTTTYLMPDGTMLGINEAMGQHQGPGLWSTILFGSAYGLVSCRITDSDPQPDSEGWFLYEENPPPKALCQFKQGKDGKPFVGFPDFNSLSNISGLYWRLTGIGRHRLEHIR